MLDYIEENYPAVFRVLSIIIVVFMAFAIVNTVILSVIFKDDNASPELFGRTIYILEGEHMSPEIPDGAAVFAESDTLEFGAPVGAIALCKLNDGKYIVARIINSEINDDGLFAYRVRYDNQADDTTQSVSANLVIGQVKYHSAALGALIRFVISPLGIGCIIVVPCTLIVLYKIRVYKKKKNEPDTESEAVEENIEEENYIVGSSEQQTDLSMDKPVMQKVKVTVSASKHSGTEKKESSAAAVKVVKLKPKQANDKYEPHIKAAQTADVKNEIFETDAKIKSENNVTEVNNSSSHGFDFADKELAEFEEKPILSFKSDYINEIVPENEAGIEQIAVSARNIPENEEMYTANKVIADKVPEHVKNEASDAGNDDINCKINDLMAMLEMQSKRYNK